MSPISPRRRVSTAVLVLAAAALFATGCGDSPDTTDTATRDDATFSAPSTSAPSPAAVASGEVAVTGLVDYPMDLTVLDLDYMDWVTVTADQPGVGPTEYDGILFADIFAYVGVQPEAATLVLSGSDGTSAEVPLDSIDADEAVLAVDQNDVMNAVFPGLGSEAWVQDIVSMEFR